jgi:hypothetical protein
MNRESLASIGADVFVEECDGKSGFGDSDMMVDIEGGGEDESSAALDTLTLIPFKNVGTPRRFLHSNSFRSTSFHKR